MYTVWTCIPSGELAAPTNDINVTWQVPEACGVGRVLETSETVLNRSLSVADELTLDLVPVATRWWSPYSPSVFDTTWAWDDL